MRQITIEHSQLKREVDELRNQTDERFEIVFAVLDKLVGDDEEALNRKIGFIEPK